MVSHLILPFMFQTNNVAQAVDGPRPSANRTASVAALVATDVLNYKYLLERRRRQLGNSQAMWKGGV